MDIEPCSCERLPFTLPEFARHSWVSEPARSVWAPRFARIARAWLDIEWRSVAAGVRECGLVWITPDQLPTLIPAWQAAHLSAVQLHLGSTGRGDSAAGSPAGPPGMVCVVVGSLNRVEELRHAWAGSDNETVGRLLGYPACCRAFFHDVWVTQRCIDTTWAMAEGTAPSGADHKIRIEPDSALPPLANILWRWLGVRAVPHLPCRFDCPSTIALGQRLLEIGAQAGYADEVEWIAEILCWPVEWSALHGIAEIKSPLTKISTRSDATAGKRVVQWAGTNYPAEGAVGLRFPYQKPKAPLLTASRPYRRGLAHAAADEAQPAWRYADNGFASEQAMRMLHEPIVAAARDAVANMSGNVLDLGCGNGALVAGVCEGRSDLVPFGIDSNEVALEHARQLLPHLAGNFVVGDIFDTELWDAGMRRYALALLMPGRLLEVPEERALRLLDRLQSSCARILVYAYPDWDKHRLDAIARQFGVELEESGSATIAYLKQ